MKDFEYIYINPIKYLKKTTTIFDIKILNREVQGYNY